MQIEHEIVPMVKEAMAAGAFIGGPQVSGFEEEFAEFCSSKYFHDIEGYNGRLDAVTPCRCTCKKLTGT